MPGCLDCRYHAREERVKALRVVDPALEIVEYADEPQIFVVCRHSSAGRGREVAPIEAEPGADCELWEAGEKRGLSDELRALLARRGL